MIKQDAIFDCSTFSSDRTLEADVVVIGTGAGGGITAQILAEAGLKVIMVEEGAYKSTQDFHMQESEAYPELYQEVASRKTEDKAITLLQGKTVGGGTTVNWTSCFHIPDKTLEYWRQRYEWNLSSTGLQDAYQYAEKLLNIVPWPVHNPSNEMFMNGAKKLNWHHEVISRNVKACRNLGYCGLGCPVGAKQSTLNTCIPAAIEKGTELYTRLRATKLHRKGDSINFLECHVLDKKGVDTTGVKVRIIARQFILSAGGIGSPALLLRSRLPDPHELVGKRTFLHVTVASAAWMKEKIEPYYGAPQTIHSNEFLWRDGIEGKMGYKIETTPMHPVLAATAFNAYGKLHNNVMSRFSHIQPLIALMRDGFHEDSPGGEVKLHDDGSPYLDYPLTGYLWEGIQSAYQSMQQLQFATGAREVMPIHSEAAWYSSAKQASSAIPELSYAAHRPKMFSAHLMGGCAMSRDENKGIINLDARHHFLSNLYVIDGSIFPTSVGANPSLPIYAMASYLAQNKLRRKV